MLVLSRKKNESICVGDDVRVTVVKISPNQVRIGVEAPGETRILRMELLVDASGEGIATESLAPVNR